MILHPGAHFGIPPRSERRRWWAPLVTHPRLEPRPIVARRTLSRTPAKSIGPRWLCVIATPALAPRVSRIRRSSHRARLHFAGWLRGHRLADRERKRNGKKRKRTGCGERRRERERALVSRKPGRGHKGSRGKSEREREEGRQREVEGGRVLEVVEEGVEI